MIRKWEKLGDIKILIVEDDPFNRLLVKSLLDKLPRATFIEAGDGLEALDILKETKIDIMLLDLHMPNMNGHETLLEVKKHKEYDDMAILVMTTDDLEKVKLYDEGTDDFISKPFRLDELESKTYSNIEKKRLSIIKNNKMFIEHIPNDNSSFSMGVVEKSQKDFFLKMVMLKTKANPKERLRARVVAVIAKALAQKLGYDKRFLNNIYYASLIRDIGVMVLCTHSQEEKKFSIQDREMFHKYILLGYELVSGAIETEFIKIAKSVILQYNEFSDGSGIPYGIEGKDISDEAMMVSVAETFEALLSKRAYRDRESYSDKETYDIFCNSKHKFNNRVLDTLLQNFSDFIDIRENILSLNEKSKATK